jgi:hypothetical protein
MLRFCGIALVVIVTLLLSPVRAADPTRIGDFWLFPAAPKVIVFHGTITSQTPLDFRTASMRRPDAELLVLSSDGGQLNAGLLFADDVFTKGISTYIPPEAACLSACAFVFLAGKSRLSDGDLGVHQFYGGENTAESAQFAVSDILTYLRKFGTSDGIIDTMLRTPSEEIHVFDQSEAESFEISRNAEIALARTLEFRHIPVDAIDWGTYSVEIAATPPSKKLGAEAPPAPVTKLRFAIYPGVDFYGADVAKVRTNDVGQCLERCMEHRQCQAITFNTNPTLQRGPNCFLKSGTGRTAFHPDAFSGRFLFNNESETIGVEGTTVRPTDVFTGD